MRTLILVLGLFFLNVANGFAGELERAPHEKGLVEEYQQIMNGEISLDVEIPTESFDDFVAKNKIFDQERVAGKNIGRAPAVLEVEDISEKAISR